MQPRARHLPVTRYRALRNAKGLRSLHLAETGKEAALHDVGQSLVHSSETIERFIQREQGIGTLRTRNRGRIATLQELERNRRAPRASASPSAVLSGVVDEDATHCARGEGKELAAIDPLRTRLFREP